MNRRARYAIALAALAILPACVPVPAWAQFPEETPTVQEDEPGWDCVTMGNRICGPTSVQGITAGCYNDEGTIVAAWPCHVVINPDGSSDVYEGYGSDIEMGS